MALNSETIKSRERVQNFAEVFTSEREVNAMINLVQHEAERIESRFLEPACGNGNFLAPILEKKLEVVKNKYKKNQIEFERYAVVAVGSIYGVEILEDNVNQCRDRLYGIFDGLYSTLYEENCKKSCRDSIRFILDRNILWGDALTLKTVSEKSEPIVFSEWSLVKDGMIKRRDFQYAELADFDPSRPTLFSLREVSDTGEAVFSPMPVKEFPLVHFLQLAYETST